MSEINQTKNLPENKMGVLPINRLLLSMAIPMMFAMLIQSLYNIVDRIYVSFLSETALAAVSLTFPLQSLMLHIAVGIGVGVSALLSKNLGERRPEQARQAALNGLFLGVCCALIFMAFGVWGMDLYFGSQNASGEILVYGRQYLSWVCLFSATLVGQVLLERLLISTGKTFYQMISQTAGALVNIILDPIMIFGWLGCPALGVSGAAIATVIAEATACALALYFNLAKNHELTFSLRGFRPDFSIIRKIFSVGVPSLLMGSLFALTSYLFNVILMNTAAGETGVAVIGVVFALQGFIFMPVFALNNALVPIVAYNFGARNRTRILRSIKRACLYAVAVMLCGMAVLQIFPGKLLLLFNATDRMLLLGVPALQIIALAYPFAALNIVFSSVFQALGKGWASLLTVVCQELLFWFPAAYLLALLPDINAVWWSMPLAFVCTTPIGFFILRRIYARQIKPLGA